MFFFILVCVCVYIHYINMSLKLSSLNAFFKKPGENTYISPIAMRRPKSRVFAPFWSEDGYMFAHFGLESGMAFQGTTRVYEGIYRFNAKWLVT